MQKKRQGIRNAGLRFSLAHLFSEFIPKEPKANFALNTTSCELESNKLWWQFSDSSQVVNFMSNNWLNQFRRLPAFGNGKGCVF
jgi:hypothetical protein